MEYLKLFFFFRLSYYLGVLGRECNLHNFVYKKGGDAMPNDVDIYRCDLEQKRKKMEDTTAVFFTFLSRHFSVNGHRLTWLFTSPLFFLFFLLFFSVGLLFGLLRTRKTFRGD